MDEKEFYINCAIMAMQSLLRNSNRFSSTKVFNDILAKNSFDIADAMLEEYKNRVKSPRYMRSEEEEYEDMVESQYSGSLSVD